MEQRRQFLHVPVICDLDAAVLANAPEIIALQVHDHRQFGGFLRARDQFPFQGLILGLVASSRPRALDRPGFNDSAALSQEQFRRGGGNLEIATIQKCREGRGRNFGQPLKQLPSRQLAIGGEAMGKVHLVDVPVLNVILGALDGSKKLFARDI